MEYGVRTLELCLKVLLDAIVSNGSEIALENNEIWTGKTALDELYAALYEELKP